MLHLRNQILEYRIGHVADKQITLGVLGGEEMFVRIRGFGYHARIFGVSGTVSRDSGFQVPRQDSGLQVPNFGVSGASGSGFQVPNFGVSGARLRRSVSAPGGLGQVVCSVTLLNTDSNLTNTRQHPTPFIIAGQGGRKKGIPGHSHVCFLDRQCRNFLVRMATFPFSSSPTDSNSIFTGTILEFPHSK